MMSPPDSEALTSRLPSASAQSPTWETHDDDVA